MRVIIPSALRSYTGGRASVEAEGATVDEVLRSLDGRYPGFRFRVVDEQGALRPHLRVSVNEELAALGTRLKAGDELALIMAFSGG
ncbi:MAG: MoaD/ThiS family protein [Elusimicrobia bacterium]|nr:MoaD/ThiS family protein [Elusimicrobiota bacterium]